ncbi:MAG: GGDEF domain-containing protein [Gammaproteobacteria bacterium]|nr:GGDEF domain-containing protein [Gammaproteobacteria bacterium]MCW8958603.1 GGDEF domain-containing protein [Gammaproteobacteria bacterium]MCW8972109.1 GGDEF domain-containing protein [Gammaproteobacteria bacterium]MCW8993622.1 GGDEF domain-containing protein [Gammaproteobacteria bacterium]
MAGQRLSIRSATTLTLIGVGTLFVLLSWSTSSYFRNAALEAQTKSLARIIEVASQQVLRDVEQLAMELGTALHTEDNLAQAYTRLQHDGNPQPLLKLLDDPLVNGFVGNSEIELVKLRLYTPELTFVTQSRAGLKGLPPALPAFLQAQASRRTGAERLKALGGLWLQGYLEILVNPTFSMAKVETITHMPVFISLASAPPPLARTTSQENDMLPITFTLEGDDGQAVYRLTGLEDVSQLNRDMYRAQVLVIASFISITFITLLLVLLMLDRGLFRPIRGMLLGIESYRNGELETTNRPSGLRELHTLGATFNDMMAQNRRDMRQLERYSNIDDLTNLANRRYFDKRLKEEWSRASRQQAPIAVLFIDIDYFKRFNDHYGHPNGDKCLQRIAVAIEGAARRESDIAARYGGEEFVIMLPDTELEGARRVAEKLQQAVGQLRIEHARSRIGPHVTLSIGIAATRAQFPESPDQLLAMADRALYQAKARGRNCTEAIVEEDD